MECEWKQCIKEKLESMNVEGSEIEKITDNIIFYPRKEKNPVDPGCVTWAIPLIRRLKDTLRFEDNIGAATNYAILLGTTIANFHASGSLKSSDNDQVEICTEPNQNTDGSFSQKRQQLQSGNDKSLQKKDTAGGATVAGAGIGTGSGGAIKRVKQKKDIVRGGVGTGSGGATKECKVKDATTAGGITGGILGGIAGGIAGGVIGAKAIGGAMAIVGGATIGVVGGGIVGVVIFALIVYFCC
uniref:Uncharacterized protein n=1 Tax=Amphimedon queenslandica TaxID=400682 RepID=A0A1X7T3C2_AMPQE